MTSPRTPDDATPEFVGWTLAHACPMRELGDWRSPSQTERLLRPLRACSEAIAEGRVSDGVATIEASDGERLGFRIADCLSAFGDLDTIDRLCATCPANASLLTGRPGFAGCYGELPRLEGGRDLAAAIDAVWPQFGEVNFFVPTQSIWYGLWMAQQPTREQRRFLYSLFAAVAGDEAPSLRYFLAALRTSLDNDLSLIVELSPAGELVDDAWIVAAHCPRCRAERPEPARRRCPTCGDVNHPLPARKRKRRGLRPYRPLAEL